MYRTQRCECCALLLLPLLLCAVRACLLRLRLILCLVLHVDGIVEGGGGGGGVAEILDKYVICRACGGIGIKKYVYNHMLLQKTCEGMISYAVQR